MDPVYGFGVSAHSFDGCDRYSNDRDTVGYVTKINTHGRAEVMREPASYAAESAFLGLRLNEGIDIDRHQSISGVDLTSRIAVLRSSGLVEEVDGRLRLTRRGMLFSNEVFAEFV